MRLRRLAADAVYWTAKHAAGGYVAGQSVDDALRVCRRLAQRGLKSTICPWDKHGDAPAQVFSRYQQSLERLNEAQLDCYLSVKLPSLAYDAGMVRALLEAAGRIGQRVHFDALGPDSAEATLRLVERLRADYANIGCTLPARWSRSAADAERCVAAGVAVRVVKGQWPDTQAEPDIERSFLRIIERLCLSRETVAVASHDRRLAAQALTLLSEGCVHSELELLYGLPLQAAGPALALRVPVRVYVPYDYGYLPYAVSQLRSKPWMAWWLVRDAGIAFGQRAAAVLRGAPRRTAAGA